MKQIGDGFIIATSDESGRCCSQKPDTSAPSAASGGFSHMAFLPSSGTAWAWDELSLDATPVGCGIAGCPSCNKSTDENLRQRRAIVIAQLFRFIEETGDGLLPYILVEALKQHPNVQAYLDHMLDVVPFRNSEEFQAVMQQRVRFYTLLLEDLRAVEFFHKNSISAEMEKSHGI